jgi:hypothetical protein
VPEVGGVGSEWLPHALSAASMSGVARYRSLINAGRRRSAC